MRSGVGGVVVVVVVEEVGLGLDWVGDGRGGVRGEGGFVWSWVRGWR